MMVTNLIEGVVTHVGADGTVFIEGNDAGFRTSLAQFHRFQIVDGIVGFSWIPPTTAPIVAPNDSVVFEPAAMHNRVIAWGFKRDYSKALLVSEQV